MNAVTQKLLARQASTVEADKEQPAPAAPIPSEEDADVQDSSIENENTTDAVQTDPTPEVEKGEFTGTYAANFVTQIPMRNSKKIRPVNGIFTPRNDDEKARLEHLANTGVVTRIYATKE